VASLSQGRTAAAQCGLFTHKSVPVIFEPPCKILPRYRLVHRKNTGDPSVEVEITKLFLEITNIQVQRMQQIMK